MNNNKIVLITTGQPSGNPRVVKEADALQDAGFDVTLLYCFFIQWASEKDEFLLKHVKWKYKMVGGSPIDFKKLYLFTRIRYKIANILNRLFSNHYCIAERAQARAYDELLIEAKKIKADWYIGHNLGALAIAVNAAKYHKAKAGFDFEDYHRQESDPMNIQEFERVVYLENKYIKSLSYYTTASDLITTETKKNHPYFNGSVATILNCFPKKQQPTFAMKKEADTTLKLFWFSQTIGLNRGLEVLIQALKNLGNNDIHLTLVGRCNEDFRDFLHCTVPSLNKNIHFAGIIQPEDLPTFAAQFDIGMAIELSEPYNRNICLTNKIFTYLLAGNAIILSETAMQSLFNEQYNIGESFEINNTDKLAQIIKHYLDHEKLNRQKKANYELANSILNWEIESKKLVALIN